MEFSKFLIESELKKEKYEKDLASKLKSIFFIFITILRYEICYRRGNSSPLFEN